VDGNGSSFLVLVALGVAQFGRLVRASALVFDGDNVLKMLARKATLTLTNECHDLRYEVAAEMAKVPLRLADMIDERAGSVVEKVHGRHRDQLRSPPHSAGLTTPAPQTHTERSTTAGDTAPNVAVGMMPDGATTV
jgi:hypothetical protein